MWREMTPTTSSQSLSKRIRQTPPVCLISWSTPRFVAVKSELFSSGTVSIEPGQTNRIRYPIRDPFFKMMPRSMITFMNAWTSSDNTSYPFATTNKQDFKNLLSVYLDATLHPLLKETDFKQEGWRLGPENPRAAETRTDEEIEDLDSPRMQEIGFKGVVYNEMKGQVSNADYLYYIQQREHIVPDLNNSGGDPQRITDLTHKQLVDYHSEHYHPSNATLFSYGDQPLDGHLEQVSQVLDGFSKRVVDTSNKKPIDLSNGPLDFAVEGPLDPMLPEDKQAKTSISWYMTNSADPVERFACGLISTLLFDGYGSPMYKALIESGLGSSFSANTGVDSVGAQLILSAGVNGVAEEDIPKVKEAITQVFSELAFTGVSKTKVEGALHQAELSLKHNSASFGLGLMQRILSPVHSGLDPLAELSWNDIKTEFLRRYAQEGYLEDLIINYFLKDKNTANEQCMSFTMLGSPSYAAKMTDNEQSRRLDKIEELINQEGSIKKVVEKLEDEELALLKVQEDARDADLSCLPTLRVEDIPRTQKSSPIKDTWLDDVSVTWQEAPTNGLTYFQATMDFKNSSPPEMCLLPLFSEAIMRIGTKNRTIGQWEDRIKLKTGGINASPYVYQSPTELNYYRHGLGFSGYGLSENVPQMLDIIQQLTAETDFTNEESAKIVEELVRNSLDGAMNRVADSGHVYAANYAAAALSAPSHVSQLSSGLLQIDFLTSVNQDLKREPHMIKWLMQRLQEIQRVALANTSDLRLRVVCSPEEVSKNERAVKSWLSGLSKFPDRSAQQEHPTEIPLSNGSLTFAPIGSQVYYRGTALRTVPWTHPDSAPLAVLSELLTHNYLHPEVREKGGAYGANASSRGLDGLFVMSSYRDPNPLNTSNIFASAGEFAVKREWTSDDLRGAKLGIFQGLDAPVSVNNENLSYFQFGITPEMRQAKREQFLDVTAQDVKRVAEKYLIAPKEHSHCLLGGERPSFVDEKDGWKIKSMGQEQAAPEEKGWWQRMIVEGAIWGFIFSMF